MKYLETGNSFHGGLARKPGRGLIRRGLVCVCVWKRFWDGCLSI